MDDYVPDEGEPQYKKEHLPRWVQKLLEEKKQEIIEGLYGEPRREQWIDEKLDELLAHLLHTVLAWVDADQVEHRRWEQTWPAALTLKVEIANGGGFEFDAPAATLTYERGDEVACERYVLGCSMRPVVCVEGVWYCRLHDPTTEEKIVLYRTWTGQIGDHEPVTVRARVVYPYVDKPDHVDLELLELRPGQVVHNVRHDPTLRAGWCWPDEVK